LYRWTFATSVIPGWHTIFPPYFVAGRILRFAMVNTLLIIMRKVLTLKHILLQHIELMNVIMITGSIVGVAYITELYRLVFWCRMEQYVSE
jgi:molybdopterin-containing oxidoreductase family membrane subunit